MSNFLSLHELRILPKKKKKKLCQKLAVFSSEGESALSKPVVSGKEYQP